MTRRIRPIEEYLCIRNLRFVTCIHGLQIANLQLSCRFSSLSSPCNGSTKLGRMTRPIQNCPFLGFVAEVRFRLLTVQEHCTQCPVPDRVNMSMLASRCHPAANSGAKGRHGAQISLLRETFVMQWVVERSRNKQPFRSC